MCKIIHGIKTSIIQFAKGDGHRTKMISANMLRKPTVLTLVQLVLLRYLGTSALSHILPSVTASNPSNQVKEDDFGNTWKTEHYNV